MKVILTDRVKSLGNIGDIVNVSAGHARNYLIPKSFAVVADDAHKKELENQKRALTKKIDEAKGVATDTQKKISGITLELIKKVGANGKLFGSVTNNEISLELEKQGIDISRRSIVLDNPIKSIGSFVAKAKIFEGVEADFTVVVKIDPKQEQELKARAEEAAEFKAKEKAELEARIASGEAEADEKKELTEEERLKKEADALLRSY